MTSLTPLSALSNLSPFGAGVSAGSQAAETAMGTASGPDWSSGELAKIVTILLGLILIVAGLFSFKQVRETAASAVKVAAA